MNAIILVGGYGTRLRPFTLHEPKPVLPFANQPFIESLFFRLANCGIKKVVLSAFHETAKLKKRIGAARHFGLKISVVKEKQPLGTGGAIRWAWPDESRPCLVMNGDILSDLDISPFIRDHQRSLAEASLWTIPVKDPSAFGVIESDRKGRISRFVEKPKPGQSRSHNINAGMYLMEPSVLQWIKKGEVISIERQVFPKMLNEGALMRAWSSSSRVYWKDLGTPQNYLGSHQDFLQGIIKIKRGSKSLWAAPKKKNLLGSRVRLAAGVKLETTCLGDGCRVEKGAFISSSVLMARCTVGPGAVVEGAILGAGVQIGAGAVVRPGSLIAANTKISAYSVI